MGECIYINGPTNIVRLYNQESEKVLYIFFDIHLKPDIQTKCDNIRSEDIDKFLINTFDDLSKESDKIYDCMFEIRPLTALDPNKRNRYLDKINFIFNKSFNINQCQNIVERSSELPNVRMHWLDIRDILLNSTIDLSYTSIPIVIYNLNNKLSTFNLRQYVDLIKIINAQLINLYNLIYANDKITNPKSTKPMFSTEETILSSYSSEDYAILSQKVIYKLLKSYKNKSIQLTILLLINGELHNMFLDYFDSIKKYILQLEEIIIKIDMLEKTGVNINNILLLQRNGKYNYGIDPEELKEYTQLFKDIQNRIITFILIDMGLYLMDLFMLRRFLDKSYITNAISYTGQYHSLNYIRLLVKYFNFTITHNSYIKDNNIDSAIMKINKSETYNELIELFFAPVLNQCSKIRNFPKLFK